MKKQIVSFTLIAAGFLLGATALSALASSGNTWTAPTMSPPNGNVPAPINVGPDTTTQEKTDSLIIDGVLGLKSLMFNPGAAGSVTQGNVLTASDSNGDVAWAAPSSAGSSGSGSGSVSGGITSIIPGTGISVSSSNTTSTGGLTAVNHTQDPNYAVCSTCIYVYWNSVYNNTSYKITVTPSESGITINSGSGSKVSDGIFTEDQYSGGIQLSGFATNGPYTFTVTKSDGTSLGTVSDVVIGYSGNVTVNNTLTPSYTTCSGFISGVTTSFPATCTAMCPSGKEVIGGGCTSGAFVQYGNVAPYPILETAPNAGYTGWSCAVANPEGGSGSGGSVTGVAICE